MMVPIKYPSLENEPECNQATKILTMSLWNETLTQNYTNDPLRKRKRASRNCLRFFK
jgi:hypothetical protein